jgi:hypothetical protein
MADSVAIATGRDALGERGPMSFDRSGGFETEADPGVAAQGELPGLESIPDTEPLAPIPVLRRSGRISALQRVAGTIPPPAVVEVDRALDDFIAEAQSSQVDMEGWTLADEKAARAQAEAAEREAARQAAEAARLQAEEALREFQRRSSEEMALLKSRLAEAEERAREAEERARVASGTYGVVHPAPAAAAPAGSGTMPAAVRAGSGTMPAEAPAAHVPGDARTFTGRVARDGGWRGDRPRRWRGRRVSDDPLALTERVPPLGSRPRAPVLLPAAIALLGLAIAALILFGRGRLWATGGEARPAGKAPPPAAARAPAASPVPRPSAAPAQPVVRPMLPAEPTVKPLDEETAPAPE